MDVSACRSATDPPHLGGYIEGGDPGTWYPAVWDWAYDRLGVRTVLDVGCGEGHTVRYFSSLGCEVLGIDGSAKAMRDSVAPGQQILHDFTDGPFDPRRTFDLVWSCEFVEHVDEKYSTNFLRTFQYSKRYVIMTHAVPGQAGYHHVNCQSSSYWVQRMREHGFVLDYRLTRTARAKSGHGYFRGSGLVFIRENLAQNHVPDPILLKLLSAEWFPRRAFAYLRRYGLPILSKGS